MYCSPQVSLCVLGVYLAGHRSAGGCLGHMCNFCDSDPRTSSRVCLSRAHPSCEQRGTRGSPRSSPLSALAAGQGPMAERLVRGLKVTPGGVDGEGAGRGCGCSPARSPGAQSMEQGRASLCPSPHGPTLVFIPLYGVVFKMKKVTLLLKQMKNKACESPDLIQRCHCSSPSPAEQSGRQVVGSGGAGSTGRGFLHLVPQLAQSPMLPSRPETGWCLCGRQARAGLSPAGRRLAEWVQEAGTPVG